MLPIIQSKHYNVVNKINSRDSIVKTVALLGAGRWGKNLARNFYSLGVLHTLCDPNESLLDHYQKIYPDIHLTSNYTSVLANDAIKQVVIASPAPLHFSLAKQALESGKDVYVEKPLCLDVKEGEELIKIADKKGKILMVGHILQYHSAVKTLKEIIATGELGKLHYIASNRLNLGSFRVEENALWNFAPHDISVILSIAGHVLPEDITCTGGAYISEGVADTTMTTMRFSNDLRAHIYVSWLHPFKEQKLIVIGSNGMAVFDDTKPWEEKLVLYRNHVKWSGGTFPEANQCPPEYVKLPPEEPLKEECLHFLNCCRDRITPKTDGKEGVRVLSVLQAAQESLAQDGIKVSLNDYKAGKPATYYAHETAVIDKTANIGAHTKIWHFSHIMEGAVIGENCNMGQNVVISPGTVIGNRVKIQNNVSVYTGVTLEDDVFLGPSMVFTNIKNPRSEIVRKKDYIATYVRKGATIGANATIIAGIEIGRYAFIGAGSVVTKSVKPFSIVIGNPAKAIGWMSRYGEKLDLPLENDSPIPLRAVCPKTNESYYLLGNSLLSEDEITENEQELQEMAKN